MSLTASMHTLMRFSYLLLAALSVVSLSSWAQPAPKAPAAKSLLWQISGKQLAKPSYVFGTMHLVCAGDLTVSRAVRRAMAKTGQITMELDMDNPTMQEQMRAHLTMLFPTLLGCTPGSYEMALVELAHARKMEVTGLETVDEQMETFDQMPCRQQARMLVDLVGRYGEAQQEFTRLAALYQAQDIEGLFTATREGKFGMQALEAELLTNRNKRWVPLMTQQATRKPTFFAVGAAHLGGPEGVLALLRQQGYQVKPVRAQMKAPRKTKDSQDSANDAFMLLIGRN